MYEEWRFTQTGNILDTQKRIFDGSTFDNLFLKKLPTYEVVFISSYV